MPRNSKWSESENVFLTGILNDFGDKPRSWPEDVKARVKDRLVNRTSSGIYQQTLKIIKARSTVSEDATAESSGFTLARGA
jgi:hypothetical protein